MLVTILANAECPHCVQATETLTGWCCAEGIPVAGLDVRRHPEAAEAWRVEHSPALLLEADHEPTRVFAGLPTHAEFLAFAGLRSIRP